MSRIRAGIPLLAVALLAMGALGAASAGTHAGSKYGGTLVVGLSAGEPDTLDPTFARSGSSIRIFPSMCQRLYDFDSKATLVPVLAAAVPALSKDKLSYTVQLRKGIEFNDGTPFDAQAVVTSIQRFVTYPGSSRTSDYASLDSVSASGPYTVVYRLKSRDSTFTAANAYALSPTQLTRLGDNFASKPVCVGPFMFDHRVVGDNVTLIKSPYYYDQKNVYLDKIVFKPMPEAAVAAAALKAGDIQVLDQVSSTELAGVRQNSSLRVIESPQLGWRGIVINIGNRRGIGGLPYTNTGTALASSAKLRQAFEEAIDRNTLNKVVFDGLMQPSCTLVAPANAAWYDATKVACTPYDPGGAKKLVAGSGISKPTVRLLTPTGSDFLRLAQFIQAQEAAVGITVAIEATDNATATARATSGDFDTYIGGFVPGSADPHNNIYAHVATSGVRNYSGYSSPRLDLIVSNGLKATSTKARSTLYRVAQQVIQDDRPLFALYNPVTFAAFSTDLTGVVLTANGGVRVANARFR